MGWRWRCPLGWLVGGRFGHGSGTATPDLTISASGLTENSAQGTAIGTFGYPNAVAPSGKALSNVIPAGTLQLVGDALQAGATPVDYEANTSISYRMSYTDGGVTYNFDRTVSVVNIAAPINIAAPVLSGTAQVGQTLAATTGTWSGSPSSYARKCQRSSDGAAWSDISGATGATYVVQAADDGLYLRAGVAGVSGEGTGVYAWSGASAQVTAAAGDTTAPVVTASSYNSGTQAMSVSVTEAESLPCAFFWAAVATGSTPSAAQIEAGTGGGILEAGTQSLGSGANSFTISLTDTSIDELHFVVKDGAGNSTGTPSGAANTILTGIVVPAAGGIAPVGYSTATGTALTYPVPLTGTTGFDGGAGGDAAVGDLAVVVSGFADNSDLTPGVDPTSSPGWTTEADMYADDTRDANLGVAWKVLTSAEITAGVVNVNGTNNAAKGGASLLLLFRGQSASPFKAKATPGGLPDGDAFDPPALVTTVADSYVLCIGGSTRAPNDGTVGTPGTGATEIANIFRNGSTRAFFTAVAFSKGNAAGTTVDQAARTGTTNNAGDSWVATTIEVA